MEIEGVRRRERGREGGREKEHTEEERVTWQH